MCGIGRDLLTYQAAVAEQNRARKKLSGLSSSNSSEVPKPQKENTVSAVNKERGTITAICALNCNSAGRNLAQAVAKENLNARAR